MKFLDPKNDLVFKRIFGEHPRLLISFLNSVLPLTPEETIKEIEYIPTEQVPEIPVLKDTIVDVKCTDKNGNIFIVEMQFIWTEAYMNRILFNSCKAYVRQLEKGQEYKYLQPVYGLSILNDTFNKDEDRFYHHYKIVNVEETNEILKGLQFVFIELPKFKPDSIKEKKLMVLWLRFLKEIDEKTEQIPEGLSDEPLIKEAIELSRTAAFNKAELDVYDRFWDIVSTQRTLASGFYSKGLQQGIQQGMQIGVKEAQIETAKKCVKEGLTDDLISKLCGLTIPEVKKIREEMGNNH